MEGRYFSFLFIFLQIKYATMNMITPSMLKSVHSTEEFMQRFVKMPNGAPVNVTALGPAGSADGEAMLINGGSVRMAQYDRCEPRYVSVAIPQHQESNVVLWPPCTRVMRCGGCCPTDSLQCEPTETELVELKVFKYLMPDIGSAEYIYGGLQSVFIEQHKACDSMCRIKPTHCNPNVHDYLVRDCRCKCRQTQTCATDDHTWRESTCKCECNQREECGAFARWDESTCRCDMSTRQLIMGGMTEEERQELRDILAVNGGNVQNPPRIEAPPTTTTPAPTTRAPPQGIPGCAPQTCLPGWTLRKFSYGRCACMPGGFGLPGRRRRSVLQRMRNL